VRKAEALELRREDFTINAKDVLVIDCPAKKGGDREPLEARIDLPFIDLIIDQVNHTLPSRRVWAFTGVTAWRIVKRVMPEHYPHFFRLNRAVHFLDDPTTTIPEMQAWFGWKNIKSVNSYLGHSRRHVRRQSERLGQDLNR